MKILLTDEEIWDIVGDLDTTYDEDLCIVAKAQLKKVVEDAESRKVMGESGFVYISYTDKEWQALKKEAGL